MSVVFPGMICLAGPYHVFKRPKTVSFHHQDICRQLITLSSKEGRTPKMKRLLIHSWIIPKVRSAGLVPHEQQVAFTSDCCSFPYKLRGPPEGTFLLTGSPKLLSELNVWFVCCSNTNIWQTNLGRKESGLFKASPEENRTATQSCLFLQ